MKLGLATVALALSLGVALPGCMTFEVNSNADIHPSPMDGHATVHGSLYQFKWAEWKSQRCRDTAIARVEHHFNGLQLFASATTLGLYVPQTVEWWCAPPPMPDESDEPELEPADEFGFLRGKKASRDETFHS